ncbi:MAG TPA: hypothetical protein V6C86_20690 [Oculatellaceae cyanobacterium]
MANQDYRPGEYLNVTVEAEEAGGYTVSINGDERRGFLPTSVSCRPGETISAQFVCMKEERILVNAKFSDHAKRAERRTKHTAEFAKRAEKLSKAHE